MPPAQLTRASFRATVGALIVATGVTEAGCYRSHERVVARDAPALDAPRVCPAMDVHSIALCTVGVPTYWWWDGHRCVASVCACSGTDCARVVPDERTCLTLQAGCPH